jgi:hypothetical protein
VGDRGGCSNGQTPRELFSPRHLAIPDGKLVKPESTVSETELVISRGLFLKLHRKRFRSRS